MLQALLPHTRLQPGWAVLDVLQASLCLIQGPAGGNFTYLWEAGGPGCWLAAGMLWVGSLAGAQGEGS